ncbi:MAG: hypothetical protein U0Q11_16190 [Vicinamibacterales bacterium]
MDFIPAWSRDFFDTLVALGFLTRSGDQYANTPETDLFLDCKSRHNGGILGDGQSPVVSGSGQT